MRAVFTLTVAVVACATLSFPALALTQAESDEIDAYVAQYMKNVRVAKQVTGAHGQTISCVDIDHQPAMNYPGWTGPVQRELSPSAKAAFPGVLKPAPPSAICPPDTVEMVLPTRAAIVHAGGVRRFNSKHPDGSPGNPP